MVSEPDTGSNVLMFAAVAAVAFALFSLVVTINKVGDINAFAVQLAPVETGKANLTVLEAININFSVNTILWGSGSVDTAGGFDSATLNTEGLSTGATAGTEWVTLNPGPLNISNLGNVNVNLTLSTNKDADGFIGGGGGTNPAPQYLWKLNDPSLTDFFCDSSGVTATALNPTAYATVTCTPVVAGLCAVANTQNVCSNFTKSVGATIGSSLEVGVQILIPGDSLPSEKVSIITATASTPIA